MTTGVIGGIRNTPQPQGLDEQVRRQIEATAIEELNRFDQSDGEARTLLAFVTALSTDSTSQGISEENRLRMEATAAAIHRRHAPQPADDQLAQTDLDAQLALSLAREQELQRGMPAPVVPPQNPVPPGLPLHQQVESLRATCCSPIWLFTFIWITGAVLWARAPSEGLLLAGRVMVVAGLMLGVMSFGWVLQQLTHQRDLQAIAPPA